MVNDALKYLRIYHGEKQKDLAEALGLSRSYISEIERGSDSEGNVKQVSLDTLKKYAEHFNVPLSGLLLVAEAAESPERRAATNFVTKKTLHILEWLSQVYFSKEIEDDDRRLSD